MTAAAPTPMFDTAERGWFQLDGKGPKHWGDVETGVACGLPAPEHLVPCLGSGPITRPDQIGACPRCVTALVIQQYHVRFKVGDRVTSHEADMTIHGTVRAVFLDDDNVPQLDLTRFWVTNPRDSLEADERKASADHWYRTARKCTPYQAKETAMTTAPTKPARKSKASPAPAAAPAEVAPKKASGRGRKIEFSTEYHPGQFVAVQEGPKTFRMGVITAREGEQYSAHFQGEEVPRTGLAFNDLGPRVMNSPAAPLRPGDRVEGQVGSSSKLMPGTGPWVVDEIKTATFVHVRNPAGEIRGEAVADLTLAQRQSVTDALIDLAILPGRDELEASFPVGTPVTFTRDGLESDAAVWAVLSEGGRDLRAGAADVLLLVQWTEWTGTEIRTEPATFSELTLRDAPPLPRPGDVVQGFAKDGAVGVFRGGVITVRPDEAHVFLEEGSVKIHPHLLAPALLDADGMARTGDVITFRTRSGRWEVTGRSSQDDYLELRNTETGEEVAGQPSKGFRIAHRANLADLCRDLQRPSTDLPAEEPAEAPAQEDLPFPVTEAQLDGALEQAAALKFQEDQAAAPEAAPLPELPGTPVLISPADLAPGTLGLHAVPLHQTARSTCNVRHHYDPVAIEELAASLRSEGQIENATGRWNAEGQVEIVAGESRRRAQLWREEQGEAGLTLLVNVRELTDAEALSISATENMRRRNMTALEECEAMHRLNEAGRSVEEIQAMFGYKTAQPVADRILAAKTLHTTARDLLDRGELSLAQAVVIARAPGEDLQLSMTTAATRPHSPASAADLSRQLTRGQFLTKSAKFDVDKSGLEVVRDIFGMFEPYFRDKGKALNAQIEWANARAKVAQAKGKHPFVAVESGSGDAYAALAVSRKYTYSYGPQKGVTGLIFYINTADGTVSEELSYSLKASARDAAVKSGEAKADAPSRPMPDSAYLEAHEIRAAALRESVVGNTHVTLALTVWGLIVSDQVGMVKLGEIHGLPKELQGMPALADAVARLRERLRPGLSAKGHSYQQHVLLSGNSVAARQPLLELLLSFSDQELLEHLNTLTAITAYEWPQYNNQAPLNTEYAYLASLTGAPERLARSFKLTDEWLKRYPRHELVALAEEAGLGRALVEDCSTLKEMRARILEHADALHRDGFVPRLVQFPAPPAPTLAAAPVSQDSAPAPAEPERERALAALAALPDEALPALLDDSGYDHTDWDTEAEMREWAVTHINTIGEQACAAWTELHATAAELAAGAVA